MTMREGPTGGWPRKGDVVGVGGREAAGHFSVARGKRRRSGEAHVWSANGGVLYTLSPSLTTKRKASKTVRPRPPVPCRLLFAAPVLLYGDSATPDVAGTA
jgi:hypothetical protein